MRLHNQMEVVGLMKRGLLLILFVSSYITNAVPLVQNITNETQVGFEIISYSDKSTCSSHLNCRVIDSQSRFYNEFLLERGKPSLVLRPIYYMDRATGIKVSLVNEEKQFDNNSIEHAYELWKTARNKKKFKNAQDWFKHWVGQDILVVPHTSEIFGYLINLSRVHISNSAKEHGTWLSFAKGVFAKLVLEIDIKQNSHKGIIPIIKVIPGEGGVCSNGMIERL